MFGSCEHLSFTPRRTQDSPRCKGKPLISLRLLSEWRKVVAYIRIETMADIIQCDDYGTKETPASTMSLCGLFHGDSRISNSFGAIDTFNSVDRDERDPGVRGKSGRYGQLRRNM